MTGEDHDFSTFGRWLDGDGDPEHLESQEIEEAADLLAIRMARAADLNLLRRVARHPQAHDLLDSVLLGHPEQIESSLMTVEPRRPERLLASRGDDDPCIGAAHLLLTIGTPTAITAYDSALPLVCAAKRDIALLPYFVRSARLRAEAGRELGIVFVNGNKQTPAALGALATSAVLKSGGSREEWSSPLPQNERPPSRLADKVSPETIAKEAALWFETPLDAAVELVKLGARNAAAALVATSLSSHSVRRFTKWVERPLRADSPLWPRVSIGPRERLALTLLPLDRLSDDDLLLVGQALGAVLHQDDLPASDVSARAQIGMDRGEYDEVVAVGILWANLMRLAAYEKEGRWQHKDQVRGVVDRLIAAIPTASRAWAVSAPEILARVDTIGDHARDLVMLATVEHTEVHTTLRRLADSGRSGEVRDQARGLLALVDGLSTPGDQMRRWLADHASRAFDGLPLFPRALTLLARTWVGSTALEETLDRCLLSAELRFAEAVRHQSAAQEELLTGRLLTELEVAFRDASTRMEVIGERTTGNISVDHRETVKTEEVVWGCDVALLLEAQVHDVVELTLATLVQIKKPETPRTIAPTDRWRLDVPQLRTMLGRTDSSYYWLLTLDGAVIAVPAAWLWGLVQGRGGTAQRSFTVHYSDVRHAAIPIRQFLAELILGTWIGSTSPDIIEFARGQDRRNMPRHIMEIEVVRQDG